MVNVGEKAPHFEAVTDEGKAISLADYEGKVVVLFFYPKAQSKGCTDQACGFRDIYEDLVGLGAEIIGVSVDSVEEQAEFKLKRKLPYPLIADTDKAVSKLYGGLGWLGKANRVTFLIDEEGMVRKKWKLTSVLAQLSLANHAQDVEEAIKELKN